MTTDDDGRRLMTTDDDSPGQSLAPDKTPGPYVEWIDTYSDAGFESLATTLERMLDRYGARLEGGYAARLGEIRSLYVR